MRTLFVAAVIIPLTLMLGPIVILAGLLGVRDRESGLYDWARRVWTRSVLLTAGVRVVVHGAERLRQREPVVYISNHVSWFDVFTLGAIIPRCKFVSKAEVFRIPVFGAAARTMGMIPIVRENRRAAFQSYDVAARRVREGASVVVYPEGTRGESYALRRFKKGPFVLATAAQVAITPVILHGTIHIQPRGSWRMRSGTVNVHLLEAIATTGMTYEDRDRLSLACWTRMAAALRETYGIDSDPDFGEPRFGSGSEDRSRASAAAWRADEEERQAAIDPGTR